MADFDPTEVPTVPFQVALTDTTVRNAIDHPAAGGGKYASFDFTHTRYSSKTSNHIAVKVVNSIMTGVKDIKTDTTSDRANTAYLPYLQNGITSMRLSTDSCPNLRYFFTANLSGCAVYIDRRDAGQVFIYHANTQLHSAKSDLEKQKPSWQHAESVYRLDTMHSVGAQDQKLHLARTARAALRKETYVKAADSIKKPSFWGKTRIKNKDWLGGTTVLGVYTPFQGWKFHYQLWGTVSGSGKAVSLVDSTEFHSTA